jgi:RimJ/RimL family protein N-acetyltransferase
MAAADITVETERLLLRPLTMSDLDPLVRLREDPDMMRYMGDGRVADESETELWLRWHMDLWAVDGYSLLGAELKVESRFIGWIGVTKPYWFAEMMPTPEIGWFIERSQWGQGLATEGASAVLRFALDELAITRIIGIYDAENVASGRVMQKIGMRFWKELPHPELGHPVHIYEAAA